MADWSLLFDDIALGKLLSTGDCELKVLGASSGTDWGNAEAVTSVIEAWLADGAMVARTGTGLRKLKVALRLVEKAPEGMNHAEELLQLACGKTDEAGAWVEGKWAPPQAGAATSVFDVVMAEFKRANWDDFGEVAPSGPYRDWVLEWTALPWVHADQETVIEVPALPASIVEDEFDDGSAVTGWATVSPLSLADPTSDGDAVTTAVSGTVLTEDFPGSATVRLRRTFDDSTGAHGGRHLLLDVVNTVPGAQVSFIRARYNADGYGQSMSGARGSVWDIDGIVPPYMTILDVEIEMTGLTADSAGLVGFREVAVTTTTHGDPTAVLDDCSDASDWDALRATSVAQGVGQVSCTFGEQGPPRSGTAMAAVRSGLAVTVPEGSFFKAVARSRAYDALSLSGPQRAWVWDTDGVRHVCPLVNQIGDNAWYDLAGVADIAQVALVQPIGNVAIYGAGSVNIAVDSLATSPASTPPGTGREQSRTLAIRGSVAAPATLRLDGGESGLGLTLVATMPSEAAMVQPPMRRWLVDGPTESADPDSFSGLTTPLTTQHYFDLPVTGLPRRRRFAVWIAAQSSAAGDRTITWSAKSRINGTEYDDRAAGATTVPMTGARQLIPVLEATLPPRPIGPDGVVRIAMIADAAVTFDEGFLVDVETGDITVLDAGTDTLLSLEAPRLEWPRPAVRLGNADDGSDWHHAGDPELLAGDGYHEFKPTAANVFSATLGSETTALRLAYKEAANTHIYRRPTP